MKFREWFDDYPKLDVLPWERKGKGRLGNELQDTQTGGKILGSPFQKGKTTLNTEITDLPTPKSTKQGLGHLGMQEVGASTFRSFPITAGTTPTISQGLPVNEL